MKKMYLLFVFFCVTFNSYAQYEDILNVIELSGNKGIKLNGGVAQPIKEDYTYSNGTIIIPHCSDPYWLSKVFYYPIIAEENDIQIDVQIRFLIERDGSTSGYKIVSNGVDPSIRKAVESFFEEMPKWIPGKVNGVVVKTYYTVNIRFDPNEDNKHRRIRNQIGYKK